MYVSKLAHSWSCGMGMHTQGLTIVWCLLVDRGGGRFEVKWGRRSAGFTAPRSFPAEKRKKKSPTPTTRPPSTTSQMVSVFLLTSCHVKAPRSVGAEPKQQRRRIPWAGSSLTPHAHPHRSLPPVPPSSLSSYLNSYTPTTTTTPQSASARL